MKKADKLVEKIVVMGGGTGSYNVLRGLKHYPVRLEAIVSMMDSGGSTGVLRDEFGVLPPGDVRRCLIALSPDSSTLRKLFDYRFTHGTGLAGHSFGNLFLAALSKIKGSDQEAIKEAARILNIKGKVLPVTVTNCHLLAVLENGQSIVGESNIDIPRHNPKLRITSLYLTPPAKAYQEAVESILAADKVIIGPGDLYTSVLPNLLVEGIKEALARTKARKIFICNIMTKNGETNNFKASDFVSEIEHYLGKGVLDVVLCNNKRPSSALMKAYKKENSIYVAPDVLARKGLKVIKKDLLFDKDLARHDPDKLAKAIMGIR